MHMHTNEYRLDINIKNLKTYKKFKWNSGDADIVSSLNDY